MEEEDDPLGLDGDVARQLDESLSLVVTVVEADGEFLKLSDDGVVRVDNGLRGLSAAAAPGVASIPSAPLSPAAATTAPASSVR